MSSENDLGLWQFLWALLSVPIMAAWRRMNKQQDQITELMIKQGQVDVQVQNIHHRFNDVEKKLESVDGKLDLLLERRREDRDRG